MVAVDAKLTYMTANPQIRCSDVHIEWILGGHNRKVSNFVDDFDFGGRWWL